MSTVAKDLWTSRWKLLASFLAILLASLSFVVWGEREFLIRRTIHKPTQIPLNAESFTQKSPLVLAQLNGAAIILWQVDITRNVRQSIVYNTPTGRLEAREGRKAPMFTNVAEENEFAVHMINGETFCGNLITRSTIGQALLKDGIIFICRSPIISKEGLLVGYVTLGFKERPSDLKREEARAAIKELARDMPIRF